MEEATNPQENLTSKDYYFDSYSHYGIHEEMLKDGVRTRTYMTSILRNEHFFRDKVVLDVGCGTGILSMFAAKAGARAVYAVDMSSIAHQASEIVAENGYKDVITVMQCKMEDAPLPEKVDIIISEWMGYALYYESMLPTVLLARDKWLKPGGIILPDRSELKIAGIEDEDYKQDKIEFWENVFGFSMRPIKALALQEPLVDSVNHECVNTTTDNLISIDINKMTASDIPFDSEFELRATRNDHIHALCLWFDVFFDYSHKPLSFSTSPFTKQTHWKQTVFYLRETLTVCKDEVIRGRLKCTPNSSNPRDLDFELEYQFCGQHCESAAKLQYRMR